MTTVWNQARRAARPQERIEPCGVNRTRQLGPAHRNPELGHLRVDQLDRERHAGHAHEQVALVDAQLDGALGRLERAGIDHLVCQRIRAPGVQVLGATVVSALGSTSEAHGFDVQNDKRKALNQFIRNSGVFDGVVEFDPAILDPVTGGMKTQFVHDTTVGGPGDKLHPNRLGYQAMGLSIDTLAQDSKALKQVETELETLESQWLALAAQLESAAP